MPPATVAHPLSPRPQATVRLQPPDPADIAHLVTVALAEDVGPGDLTTNALVDPRARVGAQILLKSPGVVAGLPLVEAVFQTLSTEISLEYVVTDGTVITEPRGPVVRLAGPARAILTGERTALNFLGQLSGVASLTHAFVEAVAGTGVVILDTRKTRPGLRALQKYAVRCGGGWNHRFGLYDAILIKDNHLRAAGGIRPAIRRARAGLPGRPVEVEAETIAQVAEAMAEGADRILLDNMSLAALREAVALVDGRTALEASGGVSLATVRGIAETGVDFISVGALTHSAVALDVSLEVLS